MSNALDKQYLADWDARETERKELAARQAWLRESGYDTMNSFLVVAGVCFAIAGALLWYLVRSWNG